MDPRIIDFASSAHEVWRKNFDTSYAETGVPSKQRVKKNSDGTEADINVPFEQLHRDWQKENLAAGEAALYAVSVEYQASQKHTGNTFMEIAAEHIHNEWMKRNPKQDYNAAQHVPYQDLPEDEKQKDRVQVQKISEIIATHSAKNALESLGLWDDEVTKGYVSRSAQTNTPSSPALTNNAESLFV